MRPNWSSTIIVKMLQCRTDDCNNFVIEFYNLVHSIKEFQTEWPLHPRLRTVFSVNFTVHARHGYDHIISLLYIFSQNPFNSLLFYFIWDVWLVSYCKRHYAWKRGINFIMTQCWIWISLRPSFIVPVNSNDESIQFTIKIT